MIPEFHQSLFQTAAARFIFPITYLGHRNEKLCLSTVVRIELIKSIMIIIQRIRLHCIRIVKSMLDVSEPYLRCQLLNHYVIRLDLGMRKVIRAHLHGPRGAGVGWRRGERIQRGAEPGECWQALLSEYTLLLPELSGLERLLPPHLRQP